MAQQFELALDDALVDTRARTWPQASGRDIKGLAKLVAKTCSHQRCAPTLPVFARCALFRAMDADPALAPPVQWLAAANG